MKISAYEENKNIVFRVEDNGLGIPEKQRKNLFTMFKLFHPKTAFGSGLGLYMVKKSAEVIGGNLTYEDTGAGSKFTLIIPKSRTKK